jgi:hypothetical protein
MINLEDLKKQLLEKEELQKRTEIVYHQLVGAVATLKSLIAEEENNTKKKE